METIWFLFFNNCGSNSVVLRMTNNAPGGCGNDLLLDDITFRACGPLVTATISGAPDSVDVCTGDNSVFTLHANVSAGYNDPVYQWQLSTDSGVSWTNIAGATNTTYIRPAYNNAWALPVQVCCIPAKQYKYFFMFYCV